MEQEKDIMAKNTGLEEKLEVKQEDVKETRVCVKLHGCCVCVHVCMCACMN